MPRELHIIVSADDDPTRSYVEVKDETGRSIRVGRWEKRQGHWHLILTVNDFDQPKREE
jgi:hypothetical protein